MQNIKEKSKTNAIENITYSFVSWKESLINYSEKIIQKKEFKTFEKKIFKS